MYAIIPGLEFLPALVIAAGVTPTDPILASSVVGKGKYAQEHVPSHIRHILQAESGCNDGAAFPFLVSSPLSPSLLSRIELTIARDFAQFLVPRLIPTPSRNPLSRRISRILDPPSITLSNHFGNHHWSGRWNRCEENAQVFKEEGIDR